MEPNSTFEALLSLRSDLALALRAAAAQGLSEAFVTTLAWRFLVELTGFCLTRAVCTGVRCKHLTS